jgi:hypothetical protein
MKMTREQVKAIFPDATDEQIDAFLNAHGSDVNKAKKSAADNNAEFERLKGIETEYEKLKGSTLTEQEKLQKQIEAAEKAEKLYKKQTNKVAAEKLFVTAGLKDEDYSELLESIVTEDAEHTTKTATSFVGILKAQKEATEKAVKEELMRNNPKPPAGGGGGGVDKKAFDAMSSKEQMEFIETNPNWKEIINKKE